jgi:hypothetical protein
MDNIKINFTKIGLSGVNWIYVTQDRINWRTFVFTVKNLRVPKKKNIRRLFSSWATCSLPRRVQIIKSVSQSVCLSVCQ